MSIDYYLFVPYIYIIFVLVILTIYKFKFLLSFLSCSYLCFIPNKSCCVVLIILVSPHSGNSSHGTKWPKEYSLPWQKSLTVREICRSGGRMSIRSFGLSAPLDTELWILHNSQHFLETIELTPLPQNHVPTHYQLWYVVWLSRVGYE